MATRPNAVTAFMAQLLAPLPDEVEPVDTPAFRKSILADMFVVWHKGMEIVDCARAVHTIAAIDFRNNGRRYGGCAKDQANMDAYNACFRAKMQQCLIPAPTIAQLRWKKRAIDVGKIPQSVVDAIAADEVRLGVRV